MKKMFYAVAVIATMAVCSCGNKAENAEAEVVEGEAVEVVEETPACCADSAACCNDSVPCDSCKAQAAE